MNVIGEKGEMEKGAVEIRDLEIKDMHNWVLCPISYCIFKNPVIAEDGYIYEHDCIFQWFLNCRTGEMGLVSPLTKETLSSSKLVPCQMARQMADTYLSLFPDKKINQYVCVFEMKTLMHYLYHSVPVGENYIRSMDNISLQDITFHQMQKCVRLLSHRNDPLLRVSLWEIFFKKIEDIHESFKNEKRENTCFSFEEEDVENIPPFVVENNEPPEEQEIPTFSEDAGVIEMPNLERNITIIEEEIENVISSLSRLTLDETSTSIAPTIHLGETDLEEGEIEEQNRNTRTSPSFSSRIQTVRTKYHYHYSYKRSLIGCMCFHSNKRILEIFLKCMPNITCPKIAKRYSHLIEDFIKHQDLSGKIATMDEEAIERLQNILLLMMEKGIPYHGWTRNGKQTILTMLYFTLDHFYPLFSKFQKKMVEMPEFFDFPPGASSGSITSNELLRLSLSESKSFHMSLTIWNDYQKNNVLSLEDIWEFCVKFSEHNIWNDKNWNTNHFYEEVLIEFIKKRGSIPMDLILIHALSPWTITHCIIEGYRIENSDKMYTFPRHENIIAPIIQEDIVNNNMNNSTPFTLFPEETATEQPASKKWKINVNSPGGRLQISRRKLSTKWSWDRKYIQLSPEMSVLGWLIHHYDSPIALLYLEENKDLEINMNSNEFTGTEYVQPIHLVFRFHQYSKKIDELLFEMLKRGASLNQRTSHGWLPIHYACRYSPNLLFWVMDNIPNKQTYVNEILYINPSVHTLQISKAKEEWHKSFYPLEIFIENHSINNIKMYKNILNLLLSHGAIKKETIITNEYHKNIPFIVEEPVVFEIGSFSTGNGKSSLHKKRNRSFNRTNSENSSL